MKNWPGTGMSFSALNSKFLLLTKSKPSQISMGTHHYSFGSPVEPGVSESHRLGSLR